MAFKRKIAEMREAEFDGSVAFTPDQVLSLPDLVALLPALLSPPRVESAGSKTGYENERALLDELELDVRVDLETVLPKAMQSLDTDGDRRLGEAIRERATALLQPRRN